MPKRKNLIFLAVALLISGSALHMARRHLSGRPGVVPPTLLPGNTGAVTALALSNATLNVSMEKNASGWVMMAPAGGRADERLVEALVEVVSRGRVVDKITRRQMQARGLTDADYGFDAPRARLSLSNKGRTRRIEFGADTPGGECVFAKVDGSSDILAVRREAFDILPLALDEIRDRTLFIPADEDFSALEIRRPGAPEIRLEATASGQWRMVRPFDCPAAIPATDAIEAALRSTVAEQFVWLPQEEGAAMDRGVLSMGLAPEDARLSLSIWTKGKAEARAFSFGASDPLDSSRVYVAALADGVVCSVDRTVFDALTMPIDSLRDRRIFPVSPDRIVSLSVDSARDPVELSRQTPESDWSFVHPGGQPADQSAVAEYMDILLSLRDTDIEPIGPADSVNPSGAVKVTVRAVNPDTTFSGVFASRPGIDDEPESLVAAFQERGIRQIVAGARGPDRWFSHAALSPLRSEEILALPPDSAIAIVRRAAGEPEQVVRKAADGSWTVAPSTPGIANADAAGAIEALFENLVARTAVSLSAPDGSRFGFAPPQLEISIATAIKNRPVILLQIGDKLPDGGAYVRVKGSDEVFAITPETLAILSSPLIENAKKSR